MKAIKSCPFSDPNPQFGTTYIARVLSGKCKNLALVITVSGKSRWWFCPKRQFFGGFRAGYLDLWEIGGMVPIEETDLDGVTVLSKKDLLEFIDGVELDWLAGESLQEAIRLFETY